MKTLPWISISSPSMLILIHNENYFSCEHILHKYWTVHHSKEMKYEHGIIFPNTDPLWGGIHGPLARCVKLQVAHAPGIPGTFSPPSRVSDPDMLHGTCVTHVPWCMPGSLTSGFLWSRQRGKRSWHTRRMRNPQFYVSGKRPIGDVTKGQ